MNIIEIRDLKKVYNDSVIEVKAIDGISLNFTEGEFTAIVGPSGSGKTTLLNLLGGLDKPSDGSIIINNTNITALGTRKLTDFRMKNIGFVFQAYNLIPVLTAEENIEFVMNLQGTSKSIRKSRVKELLTGIGLPDRGKNRPAQLSGGQQQRVAVARALAPKPKFILADEPTANLDSKSAETLLDIMEKLNHEEKTTFIFSTHDPRVVAKAHRVITLEDGKIVNEIIKE
jgi:putative ABC transport system ATP-binding protein